MSRQGWTRVTSFCVAACTSAKNFWFGPAEHLLPPNFQLFLWIKPKFQSILASSSASICTRKTAQSLSVAFLAGQRGHFVSEVLEVVPELLCFVILYFQNELSNTFLSEAHNPPHTHARCTHRPTRLRSCPPPRSSCLPKPGFLRRSNNQGNITREEKIGLRHERNLLQFWGFGMPQIPRSAYQWNAAQTVRSPPHLFSLLRQLFHTQLFCYNFWVGCKRGGGCRQRSPCVVAPLRQPLGQNPLPKVSRGSGSLGTDGKKHAKAHILGLDLLWVDMRWFQE